MEKKSSSLASSACSTFQKGTVCSGKQLFVMTQMAQMTAQYLSLVADNTLSWLSWLHPPLPKLCPIFAQEAKNSGLKQAIF